ncbi:MAG: membrane protein insertion efficiency factor YidD [Rhodothermaceae bacterium]
MGRKFFLFTILFLTISFAQNEWEKWGKKEISYQIETVEKREFKIESESIPVFFVSTLKNAYWFLFSDHDGDNCPFHPTCSEFMFQAVKQTNILKGALMFADRFTRDTNFFKTRDHYPLYVNGKFYDPVTNYKLDYSKIKYIPSANIVSDD